MKQDQLCNRIELEKPFVRMRKRAKTVVSCSVSISFWFFLDAFMYPKSGGFSIFCSISFPTFGSNWQTLHWLLEQGKIVHTRAFIVIVTYIRNETSEANPWYFASVRSEWPPKNRHAQKLPSSSSFRAYRLQWLLLLCRDL